jgi:hypothetical protein
MVVGSVSDPDPHWILIRWGENQPQKKRKIKSEGTGKKNILKNYRYQYR